MTVLDNPYIPQRPTPKQAEFLVNVNREVFFGGAAGGGKSSTLLMAALQYVHEPDYAALILRRTYADLSLPQAIMDRARDWLYSTPAKWHDKEKTWEFPSGATLTFGYLDTENDKFRYQGAELQFCGFDELTQFTESQYRYLFSRLRRGQNSGVPIRMRAAGNPGGIGHEWVKQRFIVEGDAHGRTFIPSRLSDNPHLDAAQYRQSLMDLDPTTRAQLLNGDWDARPPGSKFRREWFEIVDSYPAGAHAVRFWDMAATEPKKPSDDPDWTAGAKVCEQDGIYYLLDIRRARLSPGGVESLIRQTAELDGRETDVWIEQEPGSSGVTVMDNYRRKVLKGFTVRALRPTGKKEVRANPVSSAAEAGNVKLVRGAWINDFLDEIEVFPSEGTHDDQVDAVSGACSVLSRGKSAVIKPGESHTVAEVVHVDAGLEATAILPTGVAVRADPHSMLPVPVERKAKRKSAGCPECGKAYTMVRGASGYCPDHGWQGQVGLPVEFVRR